ncbi:MAG: sugar transferase [Firmicutes bacterium]|nr:sugar transferase [Bacillota bacterium]
MYPTVKRFLDFFAALLLLAVLSPVFAAVAVLIKAESPGPVIFRQKRAGKNRRLFTIYKFRTMRADAPKDTPTHLLQDPRSYVTGTGKVLRRLSLDELPQLVNILRGDMSFVGPRPALWNQDDLLAERERLGANGAAPGLTGWAQVNGRDELPIPVKAGFDGEYAARRSFAFDAKIALLTVKKVFTGEGIRR